MNKKEWGSVWIGVGLDGTLAEYHGWVASGHIGEPIPEMLYRIKTWIREGKTVKIFTARCSVPEQVAPVKNWLEKHGIGGLEITNVKDPGMMELWDDRCVQVERNTGKPIKRFAQFANDECWIYQGDGRDYLESLVCPVVISAQKLIELGG